MSRQEGEALQTPPLANLPPHIIRQFQEDLTNAAKALLICLGTDEACVEVPTDGGGKLVIEVLHFPPPGTRSSAEALTLLPDPIAESATWA